MKSWINFIIEPLLIIYVPMMAVMVAVHGLLVWLGWIDPTSEAQCLLSLVIGVVVWAIGAISILYYLERR